MNTPIWDFVKNYIEKKPVRLHMPGHKGVNTIGCEEYDITEIDGADVLYNAKGIIRESEENARSIFGTRRTLYSTEGSSLCIRAMIFLAKLYAISKGEKPKILAGRNAHKTFVTGAALLGVDVEWIFSEGGGLVSCHIDLADLEKKIIEESPSAVYITSPDYLGSIADIKGISSVCHRYGVPLMVDNAHGGYLKFLEESLHPMDLGADICCDSAHKTLHALTGAGYLHIGASAPDVFANEAEKALSHFASTSPSYLILESLDRLNPELSKGCFDKVIKEVEVLKGELISDGYKLIGDEPLKLTICAKEYGYTGYEIGEYLKDKNIFCEFADPDFVVMMMSADTKETEALKSALLSLPEKDRIVEHTPETGKPERVLPLSEAVYMPCERVDIEEACGRIIGEVEVSCPPAVPILVWGERIDEEAVKVFKYYGIESCRVIK